MSHTVWFAPEAVEQLEALYRYIAAAASEKIAAGYVDSIVAHCEGLALFPLRGTARDDIRPGLRTLSYKKRAVIAFRVEDVAQRVDVLGIFYGGQHYETLLSQAEGTD